MTNLTRILDEIEAAAKATSPGPWSFTLGNGCDIVDSRSLYVSLSAEPKDARFIALSRSVVEPLVAVARAALALDVLNAHQRGYGPYCSEHLALRTALARLAEVKL